MHELHTDGTNPVVIEPPRRRGWSGLLRRDPVCVAVLLLLTALTWLPRRGGPIEMRWDAGIYYTLGTSLAQGAGYRLLNEPGDIKAIQYPPLVPAIVAVHERLLGTSDPLIAGRWLKLSWFLLFAVFIVGAYYVFKRFVPQAWAFWGAVLCVINFQLYFHSNQCAAELPFALAAVVFLLAYRKDGRAVNEVLAGLAAVAAFLSRTIGIALLGAWVADAVLRRQFRRAVFRGLAALAPVLLWNGYIRSVEQSPEYRKPAYPYQRAGYLYHNVSYVANVMYKDPFRPELGEITARDMLSRFLDNARGLPGRLGAAVTSHEGFWDLQRKALNKRAGFELVPVWLASGALACVGWLVLLGTLLLLVRREWVVALSILATLAAACSAPWPTQITRYVTPIVPLLLIAAFTLIHGVRPRDRDGSFTRRRLWQLAAGSLLLFVLFECAATYYLAHTYYFRTARYRDRSGKQIEYRQLMYGAADQGLDDSLDWIVERARPADVIAVSMPGWVYLRTGLKAVMPPFEPAPERAQALLESVPVRYLMVENPDELTNFAWRYTAAVLREFPEKWRLVYKSAGDYVRVYEPVP